MMWILRSLTALIVLLGVVIGQVHEGNAPTMCWPSSHRPGPNPGGSVGAPGQ
jgi:hypothetical protein